MAVSRLDIHRLVKHYGSVTALDGMTFSLHAGEVFGFVGSNGAGKTTTMRIALGVLEPDDGEVLLDDAPLDADSRRRIGYMPEERGLYPRMRVGEQLVYLARLHGLAPQTATAAADEWMERLGVAARRRDEVQKLSLGNQQRVQLAAALIARPDVLILDEPFSGLDPVAVDVMSGVLAEQAARGVPVLFSSHQLDLVERVSDRVGIVAAGRMVASGTVDELRSQGPAELLVSVPGAPPGWADGIIGVASSRREGQADVLVLAPAADDQVILAAALATGPVREFSRRRPRLVDLYRSVVEVAA